ncbi:hypothetical protein SI65_05108 [Aspergillus cristatus]|uniref:Uncharacterized protein n=1 Tax=Aspergillus cristatus TaxID=573508 RepID=A0A1E3BH61_ASPCR|nr:hypothetical protein SI65_05108 [Aspergillus cristatus]
MISLVNAAYQSAATSGLAKPTNPPPRSNASDDITPGIPSNAPTHFWGNPGQNKLALLTKCAQEVREKLLEAGEAGNQYITVLNISKYAISNLRENQEILDSCEFRFAHVGTVGVIKVIPSGAHDVTVRKFSTKIERQLAGMGICDNEYQFGKPVRQPQPAILQSRVTS